MIERWCVMCEQHMLIQRGIIGPYDMLMCPVCWGPTVPVYPKGLDVYGTMTMYERGNDDVNQTIGAETTWEWDAGGTTGPR